MKVYIAAPFFNHDQLEQVIAVENLLEKYAVTYFSPRSFGVIKDMTKEEKELNMKKIYDKNVAEIVGCDTMIVLVDHKDMGTTWELGFVSGLNDFYNSTGNSKYHKNIVTVSLEKKPVNVMLRYCIDAHAETLTNLEQILCTLIDGRDIRLFKTKPEVNE